ncbi:Cupin domain-containing protein [Tessaracoccus bendigoensis DSM 12906]|uniref:Cupin domain-containing protein n=1 Tax=Tessaracoccus bendigoensis DSM 12906 TaxID=1123357 RepID=A0A1M6BSL1_9ACTN|nr:cupin domain-containing protein [Tessaracoccus bendigoensis]SHI51739.1 Cupin domain-containing protein [Tessaracoccus bendigoensis DSM 12906]
MAATELAQSVTQLSVLDDLPVTRDATTSRVLVNNPLLRVVDFAFDEGQLLTEHASPRAVVVTLLTGTMDFDLEGATHQLVPGDVLYMAPDARHALRATSKCHMQLVMVDVDA